MAVLYRCQQCSYEEWREADQEIWLCVVCGWMMWSAIATDEQPAVTGELDDSSGPEREPTDAREQGSESDG